MTASRRSDRARAALRRRPVYYGVAGVVLVGGAAILTAAHVPKAVILAVVVVLWAGLMYLLRWRKG